MSASIWDRAPEGVYAVFTEDATKPHNVSIAGDPQRDIEVVQDEYAGARCAGERALVILICSEGDKITVTDVTEIAHENINAYLKERGTRLPDIDRPDVPNGFAFHLAIWPDDGFGCLCDTLPVDEIEVMRNNAEAYAKRYAGPGSLNEGLSGVILIITPVPEGFSAREMEQTPVPEKTSSELGL